VHLLTFGLNHARDRFLAIPAEIFAKSFLGLCLWKCPAAFSISALHFG
jgi:hypothetical protein